MQQPQNGFCPISGCDTATDAERLDSPWQVPTIVKFIHPKDCKRLFALARRTLLWPPRSHAGSTVGTSATIGTSTTTSTSIGAGSTSTADTQQPCSSIVELTEDPPISVRVRTGDAGGLFEYAPFRCTFAKVAAPTAPTTTPGAEKSVQDICCLRFQPLPRDPAATITVTTSAELAASGSQPPSAEAHAAEAHADPQVNAVASKRSRRLPNLAWAKRAALGGAFGGVAATARAAVVSAVGGAAGASAAAAGAADANAAVAGAAGGGPAGCARVPAQALIPPVEPFAAEPGVLPLGGLAADGGEEVAAAEFGLAEPPREVLSGDASGEGPAEGSREGSGASSGAAAGVALEDADSFLDLSAYGLADSISRDPIPRAGGASDDFDWESLEELLR